MSIKISPLSIQKFDGVWGLGSGVWDLGFQKISPLGSWGLGFRFGVWGFILGFGGFHFGIWSFTLRFGVSYWVWGFKMGFGVSNWGLGFHFRICGITLGLASLLRAYLLLRGFGFHFGVWGFKLGFEVSLCVWRLSLGMFGVS